MLKIFSFKKMGIWYISMFVFGLVGSKFNDDKKHLNEKQRRGEQKAF